MAENLMHGQKGPGSTGQAGFSMVEMLMTAFILAIGLLGLCMLQTMALRGSRGSRSLTTAVRVASAVLDQVAMEGRLSWLNVTDSPLTNQSNANLALKYLPVGVGNAMPIEYFNSEGSPVNADSTEASLNTPFYTVTTTYVSDVGNAGGGGVGQVSNFSVVVQFSDAVDASNAKVQRQVVLTRRITHG